MLTEGDKEDIGSPQEPEHMKDFTKLKSLKTLKKLGSVHLAPMTKVFTDRRQNLIIQNDLSITLNSKPNCPVITSPFKILNCLKCQGKSPSIH